MREGVDFKSTVYTNSTRRLFDFIIKNLKSDIIKRNIFKKNKLYHTNYSGFLQLFTKMLKKVYFFLFIKKNIFIKKKEYYTNYLSFL